MVTGQFADKPTHGQSSAWQTGQFTEMFDIKFGVYDCSKFDF